MPEKTYEPPNTTTFELKKLVVMKDKTRAAQMAIGPMHRQITLQPPAHGISQD
jgi:hypothetical protein